VAGDSSWASGELWRFPEENCCGCGRPAAAAASTGAASPAAASGRRVLAHYLPWYSDIGAPRGGWCSPEQGDCSDPSNRRYSVTPLIGEYSQLAPAVLDYHILPAWAAGIDGFIVNVDPATAAQARLTDALFDAVTRMRQAWGGALLDFTLTISYDSKTTEAAAIASDFEAIRDRWVRNATHAAAGTTLVDESTASPLLLCWTDLQPQAYFVLRGSRGLLRRWRRRAAAAQRPHV
jgi:hypothetical protein